MIWSHDWLSTITSFWPCNWQILLFLILFESENEVTQSCPTLCDPMDCSLPGSSLHGIFQARELHWGAISFLLLTAIQSLSRVRLLVTPWTAAPQASLSFTISWRPEFAQTHIHWLGDAIQPSHPLPPSSFFDFNLCQHQHLFQWVSCSHQVAKYWSFICSVSSSNEYSGLNFLRMELVWSPCNPVQFSSVAQSCPTLGDPMNHSSPGLPVHHQLLELAQTHAHWVGDTIQPSHPLSSPPPAFNLS